MVRLLLTAIIITLTCNAYSQKKKVIYDKENRLDRGEWGALCPIGKRKCTGAVGDK